MSKLNWTSLSPAIGLIYVILSLITISSIPLVPETGASIQRLADYYKENRQAFMLANFLFIIELLPVFWFSSYLSLLLKQKEGELCLVSTLALSAAAVYVAILTINGGIALALPLRAGSSEDLVILRALSDVQGTVSTTSFIPAALMTGLNSILILRTALLKPWIGILGLLTSILQALAAVGLVFSSGPMAAGGPFSYVAYIGFLFWVAATSIALTRRSISSGT